MARAYGILYGMNFKQVILLILLSFIDLVYSQSIRKPGVICQCVIASYR